MATQRSTRRIVPPAMPAAGSSAQQVNYHPPEYVDPGEQSWTKLILIGFASFVVVGGGLMTLQALQAPAEPKALAAVEQRPIEPPGAQPVHALDANAPGWVGTVVLPDQRAILTVSTIPDDGPTARDWNENTGEPVSIALLAIDNADGADEVAVDASQAVVRLTDGSVKLAIEPLQVLHSAKRNRENAMRDFAPPFRCKPGQRVAGKFVFLPYGTNPHAITSIKLTINGKEHEIIGSFMDSAQKTAATTVNASQATLAATTQPYGEINR